MLDYMKALLYPFIDRFVKDEEGQGTVEYALIIALIAAAAIAAFVIFQPALVEVFQDVMDAISGKVPG